jgi:hypothetical protein
VRPHLQFGRRVAARRTTFERKTLQPCSGLRFVLVLKRDLHFCTISLHITVFEL